MVSQKYVFMVFWQNQQSYLLLELEISWEEISWEFYQKMVNDRRELPKTEIPRIHQVEPRSKKTFLIIAICSLVLLQNN